MITFRNSENDAAFAGITSVSPEEVLGQAIFFFSQSLHGSAGINVNVVTLTLRHSRGNADYVVLSTCEVEESPLSNSIA